jgi:CrcB protein
MTFVAVLIGGLVGTGLRLATASLIAPGSDFPWSTLLVNVVGSFALGFLVARVWPTAPSWLRAGLGTGVLGSFTTFSAVVVSLLTLTRSGLTLLAVVYLVVSLVLGLAAALAGVRLGVAAPVDPPIGADE